MKRLGGDGRLIRSFQRVVRRLTILISVLFLGCTPLSSPPLLDVERSELTETNAPEEMAWAVSEGDIFRVVKRIDDLSELPHPTPRDLFALYRKWPPPAPRARGPEDPSPPTPHLLN